MGNRIAVVDDEPDIIHLVTIHLKKAGYSVDSFLERKLPAEISPYKHP